MTDTDDIDVGEIHWEASTQVITYTSRTFSSWSIHGSQIRLIGEFTNENGPFAEDYWLAFVTSLNEAEWMPVSARDPGASLKSLQVYLSCRFLFRLVGSTTFASNIVWPSPMAGAGIFEFEEKFAGPSWLRWLLLCGLGKKMIAHPREAVSDYVRINGGGSEEASESGSASG